MTDEIDEADRKGRLSNPLTFLEAQELPYFQAVVKEALRMHPAVGLLLERVVPQGGATLGGVWFPEGVVVGMNPWVAARDQEAYGDDAYVFRPERWLEADKQQLKIMDRNFLAVSAVYFICLTITFTDRHDSLVRAHALAWVRTSLCWRFSSWCRNCFGSSSLSCRIQTSLWCCLITGS